MVQEQLKGTSASPGETKGSASAPLRRLVVVGEESGQGKWGVIFQCPADGGDLCPCVNT